MESVEYRLPWIKSKIITFFNSRKNILFNLTEYFNIKLNSIKIIYFFVFCGILLKVLSLNLKGIMLSDRRRSVCFAGKK